MVKCNAAFKAKADDAIDIPLVTALVMPAEQTLMVRIPSYSAAILMPSRCLSTGNFKY